MSMPIIDAETEIYNRSIQPKCHFCGSQEISVKPCSIHHESPGACSLNICDSLACRLLHLYQNHPRYISEITRLENMIKSMTLHIVVAPMRHKFSMFDKSYKAGFIIPSVEDDNLCCWSPIIITDSRERTMEKLEELLEQPFHIRREVHHIEETLPAMNILKTQLIRYNIQVTPIEEFIHMAL